MPVPDTLIDSMKLFEKRGFVDTYKFGPFQPVSWISVLMGQGGLPRAYNPLADAIPLPRIQEKFQVLKGEIDSRVEQMPDHGEFLAEYCGLSHD